MKILSIFKIPRSELEDRWWHRLFKVLIFASTILVFVLSMHWASESFYYYYVFSFDKNYHNYSDYKEKNWDDIEKTYSNKQDAVFALKLGTDSETWKYIDDLDRSSGGSVNAYEVLDQKGYFKDVKVRDLQTNFNRNFYRVLMIILTPLVYYLFIVHVVYRTAIYIMVGKKKTI